MSFDDESSNIENLCYTELPTNKPFAVARPDENIQLAPIVQPMTINATINTTSVANNSTQASQYGGDAQNANYSGNKPIATRSERKSKRLKNLIAGFVMLLLSVIVILPFIFSMDIVSGSMVNLYSVMPGLNFDGNININAIQNLIVFFTNKAEMANIWKSTVPSFVIGFGLVGVALNILKAIIGIIAGVKGRKYIVSSAVTLGFFVLILVMQLIGIDQIGLSKIDFMQEVVFGWKYSQTFVLLVLGLMNFLAACICAIFVPKEPARERDRRR